MKRITVDKYAAAIVRLLPVAQRDTGQSSRVASVLLSTYNSDNFHVALVALCDLDDRLYEDCITVIRGRVEVNLEPWRLVENGQNIFERLTEMWPGLFVRERAKKRCNRCDGHGRVWAYDDNESEGTTCPACKGSGRVCGCDD